MSVIPEPLRLLFEEEGAMHDQALAWIAADEELQVHLRTMATAMELVWAAGQHEPADEDGKAMQGLCFRLFNHMGASVRLALGGYMQASFLVSRDLFETAWLASYFQSHPEQIAKWRAATDYREKLEFGPKAVREALSKRDGVPSSARAKIYWDLCDYAAHPSADGLQLLAPPGESAIAGPFMNRAALPFALEGLAPPFLVSGMSLMGLVEGKDPHHDKLVGRVLIAGCEWNEQFLNVPFAADDRQSVLTTYGLG